MSLVTHTSISLPDLVFTSAPAHQPPEVAVDPELMQKYEAELKEVHLRRESLFLSSDRIGCRPRESPFRKKTTISNPRLSFTQYMRFHASHIQIAYSN